MHVSLHFIEISAVVIPPDRMRREFKEQALADLQESIRTKGLLHPLTIEKTKDGKFILRAGERRFRAISALAARGIQIQCDGRQVPLGYAPMLYMTELSPLDILELELEENVIRENLTWQEQAEARQKLLQLRRVQHAGSYSTESLAQELKPHGVRANCVLPGTIDTPQNRKDMPDADFSKWVAPAEIARVMAFLASSDASAISGAAIPVYGRS